MSSFGLYMFGYAVFIIGLAIAAHLMGAPPMWIGVGVLILVGVGIMGAVTSTKRRDLP